MHNSNIMCIYGIANIFNNTNIYQFVAIVLINILGNLCNHKQGVNIRKNED